MSATLRNCKGVRELKYASHYVCHIKIITFLHMKWHRIVTWCGLDFTSHIG